MSNNYQHNSDPKFDFSDVMSEKNVSKVVTALAVVGLIVGGLFWYRARAVSQTQAAQKVLSSCLAEFEKVRAGGTPTQWQTLQTMCSVGYEKHKSSSLAPYFLAIQADALLAQGQADQALTLLDSMIAGLPTSSPLYDLYKTKKLLIELDQSEDPLQSPAFEALKLFAYDTQNSQADYALYYLGEYYWHNKQTEQAHTVWNDLATRFKSDTKDGQSPWALLAQYKLQQLGYES